MSKATNHEVEKEYEVFLEFKLKTAFYVVASSKEEAAGMGECILKDAIENNDLQGMDGLELLSKPKVKRIYSV